MIHFVGMLTYSYAKQQYEETFVNLSEISSISFCNHKEGHSIVVLTDETAYVTKGTPREILNQLYDRVPRGAMTITYMKETE